MRILTKTDMTTLLNTTIILMSASLMLYIILESTINKKLPNIPRFITVPICAGTAIFTFYLFGKAFLFTI